MLKPYPTYRDSGVEWLGGIPTHWEVVSLRYKYSVQLGKMLDAKRITGEHLTPYLRNVDVRWGHVNSKNLPSMDIAPNEFERYTITPGDLLVCEGGEVGRSAIWRHEERVGFQKALHRLRPLNPVSDTSEFFYYAMLATAQRGVFAAQGNENTFNHLTGEALRAYRFAFPPLDEQRAIADFLDAMDARITRFIAARKRMIRLLEEKKQAVINQAVTKGLDPTVPMKDSGVEWIGEIPAHWEVRRGGALFGERNETGFPNLPILEVSLVTGVRVRDLADPTRKQVMSDRSGYKKAHQGDLPYNMMRMWQGAVGVAPVDGLVSPAYVVLRPRAGTVGAFYWRLFKTEAFMGEVKRHSRGIVSDRDRLYWADFKQLHLPYPPPAEQQEIAYFLQKECERLDRVGERSIREIALMQEYRTRLISDVVTGKLDVRGVDLGELPEFEEVPNPGDDTDGVPVGTGVLHDDV